MHVCEKTSARLNDGWGILKGSKGGRGWERGKSGIPWKKLGMMSKKTAAQWLGKRQKTDLDSNTPEGERTRGKCH